MKVIQSNKAYPPHLGGIETIVRQLAEGIQSHGAASEVVACSEDRRTHHESTNGVSVTRVATVARLASLPVSPTYGAHLMGQTADVLDIHEPSLLGSIACVISRRRARSRFKRIVVHWHSDIVRQRALAPAYRPILSAILREADAICVATPHHVTSSAFLAEVASKCHVIHFGVDPGRFALTQDVSRKADALREQYGRPLVFFSGRLVHYKGVRYLVEAMGRVPRAHLVVAGQGPLLGELKALAAASRTSVSFLPFLPEEDFVAMHHAADVFVLPSVENSEAFGIVQLEAMACGKPVVTTHLGTGVTYVNQDGITGLVVPIRDASALACAINTLLDRPEACQRMGQTARARVLASFTVTGMVAETVALYRELLGHDASSAPGE
jgi:rhamnosyl/mannosyltransferase